MAQFSMMISSKLRARMTAVIAVVLVGCGGDGDGGGEPANPAPSGDLRVSNLSVPRNYRPIGPQSNRFFVSQPVPFTLPADTVSFQLYMRGGDAELACLDQVINPNKVDVLRLGARSILDFDVDYCSAFVPQGPQFTAQPGAWQYRLNAFGNVPDDISVTLALRTGALPSNASTLAVQPFLASGRFSAADIQPALDEMRRVYEQAGVTLQIANPILVREPAFRILSFDFTDPITRRLVRKGPAGFANLFFVDDFAGGAGILGIAAGIPGALGSVSNRNGVLIGLNGHLDGNQQLALNFLAETAGHEMGHFLGLFHTTEQTGRQFDILADTPVCPNATRDRNGDGIVSIAECRGLGINNLMFWTGDAIVRQTEITADQAHVVHFSPIAGIAD